MRHQSIQPCDALERRRVRIEERRVDAIGRESGRIVAKQLDQGGGQIARIGMVGRKIVGLLSRAGATTRT